MRLQGNEVNKNKKIEKQNICDFTLSTLQPLNPDTFVPIIYFPTTTFAWRIILSFNL